MGMGGDKDSFPDTGSLPGFAIGDHVVVCKTLVTVSVQRKEQISWWRGVLIQPAGTIDIVSLILMVQPVDLSVMNREDISSGLDLSQVRISMRTARR